jgi:hypothetical protein
MSELPINPPHLSVVKRIEKRTLDALGGTGQVGVAFLGNGARTLKLSFRRDEGADKLVAEQPLAKPGVLNDKELDQCIAKLKGGGSGGRKA